jgi:hypothetical protein
MGDPIPFAGEASGGGRFEQAVGAINQIFHRRIFAFAFFSSIDIVPLTKTIFRKLENAL